MPDTYLISALSSRRGVIQGLLVLTGIYAIVLGLTEVPFFGDAVGFGIAAVVIVAAARFLKLESSLMRLVIGMPLFGPFLLGAAVTKEVPVMVDMTLAGVALLLVTFILQTPGSASAGIRGITAKRLLRKWNLSYDEIAAVTRRTSKIALIKGQFGFGSPTIDLTLFSGTKTMLGIAAQDVDRFIDDVSQQVEPGDDDNFFFMPTTAAAPAAGTVAVSPKPEPVRIEGRQGPVAGQEPEKPRSRGRGRRRDA